MGVGGEGEERLKYRISFEVDVSRQPFTSNARFYVALAPDVLQETKRSEHNSPHRGTLLAT